MDERVVERPPLIGCPADTWWLLGWGWVCRDEADERQVKAAIRDAERLEAKMKAPAVGQPGHVLALSRNEMENLAERCARAQRVTPSPLCSCPAVWPCVCLEENAGSSVASPTCA